MPLPQRDEFETVRARFQALLDRRASEPDLQRFLSSHLTVLADGLPLRVPVDSLRVRGRPGRTEADFEFVGEVADRFEFGVIELKRPGQRVVKSPRKRVVTLTNAAATAVAQAREYAVHLQERLLGSRRPEQSVARYPRMYVVMGIHDQRTQALLSGLEERQLKAVFPDDVRIVTYDQLLARYAERTQERLAANAPAPPAVPKHHVMLPAQSGGSWPRAPFALTAAESLVEALRHAAVRGISVYSRSVAADSASECLGHSDDGSARGHVYLVVTLDQLFVLTAVGSRVVAAERAELRDEREALAAAGARDHVLHQSLDPDARPWLVQSADSPPPMA